MRKRPLIIGSIIGIFIIELVIAWNITPDMSTIGTAPHKLHEWGGVHIPFNGINIATVRTTWFIMTMLVVVSVCLTRRLQEIPGKVQAVFEIIVEVFDKICRDTLGNKGRTFMPYMTTLFLFVLCCNWIGIIPLAFFEEPTKDLNTTLGLGIIAFFVSHIAAIHYKGIKRYIADYFEPMIEIKGVKIPNIILAPINVVGELGKLISHSFRLFGNILGGVIILQVVSNLIRYVMLPVGLNLFFGLFVGAVQAFVFAMLAVTYIAVLVEE
ncbi:MAG: F0F1 ATP synthase subunit A [Candidatus Omnitrophica bacterium]|nr:F0F1 ATP synthase subunit A [Candidatus Omnitrophota bacterium]